jgi:hypothetical protein
VWSRASTLPFAGRTVPTLAADDLLLLLCAHNGGKHGWRYLRWIADVADLVRTQGDRIDWRGLFGRAAAAGCSRLLCVGLMLARDLLEAPVPPEVEAAADRHAARIAEGASWMLFHGTAGDEHGLRKSGTYLGQRERLRDRVTYLPQLAWKFLRPSDRDRAVVRLPRPLGALYLGVRIPRLALKYARLGLLKMSRSRGRPRRAGRRAPHGEEV